MTSTAAVWLLQILDHAGIEVWLDGGWGVDALIEAQTRPHKDIDIVIRVSDIPRLHETLAPRGFKVQPGGTPSNFVLINASGLEIDVHAITLDQSGNGVYRMANGSDWIYPAKAFLGRGSIAGVPVQCISAEVQVLGHAEGYVPTHKDIDDMQKLRERFGVELPPHLQRVAKSSQS